MQVLFNARVAALLALSFLLESSARAQVDWPSLSFTQIVTNTFPSATHITHAGDGSGRLFITQQGGLIRIIDGTNVLADPFLDITSRVLTGTERGLFCVAFPPGYATNSHFYVNYTRKPDGATVVSRFFLSNTNVNIADTNSEQIVLTISQPFGFDNHNGGQIAFGPDGYLYIGRGDGGWSSQGIGDPWNHAQNPKQLLGKMLRIDVESGVTPYAVPTNNPFVGNTNYLPEIWALGLRNPWRFSFDRVTGDLYIADVGHFRYEEIDFQPAGSPGGQNYGWRVMEGPATYNKPTGFDLSTLTPPVTSYDHTSNNVNGYTSVTGGFAYRGPSEPRMDGIYIFGDFQTGQIWGLRRDGTNWQRGELVRLTQSSRYAISTFGEDEQGRLYLASYGSSGRIYQIRDSQQALMPYFSPANGTLNSNTVFAICGTPGAQIHYTSNGQDPTEADPAVPDSGLIQVVHGATNKLRAFRSGLGPSDVATVAFTVQVATPVFNPPSGSFTNGSLISISTITLGAVIYYTLDGTTPTTNSAIYSGLLTFNGGFTLKAMGVASGYLDSALKSVSYSQVKVETPVFSPALGPIHNGSLIFISSATPGAVIYYTVDGTTPTTNSAICFGHIAVNGGSTLKALGIANGHLDSEVQSVFYTLVDFENTFVSTLAGRLVAGFSNAIGTQAMFSSPSSICVDQLGNVYVADSGNHAIRKILPSGEVSTLAGTGIAGYLDGPATNAQFSGPTGVCVDNEGNVFVADRINCNRIRKIDTNGQVSTLAGVTDCSKGASIWQLEIDPAGNLFTGYWTTVQKITQNGTVSGLAGPGWCCPAGWSMDVGVGIDASTNIYAATEYRVWKIAPDGNTELFAGSGGGFSDGPRLASLFSRPRDATADSAGNVFISDNTRIRKIRPDGWVSTVAGTGVSGYKNGRGALAQFGEAVSLCVDKRGNIYVADAGNNCIRKIWANAVQSFTHETETSATISWESVIEVSYQVQWAEDLQTWNNLGTPMNGTGFRMTVTDSSISPGTAKRFYRVVLNDL